MTLQIFNLNTETWRLGAALPEPRGNAIGVVADGKLFVIDNRWGSSKDLLVNDPESNTWTEAPRPTVANPDDGEQVTSACAHKGRLVVLLSDGTACERANDGSWSPYEVAEGASYLPSSVAESVILG